MVLRWAEARYDALHKDLPFHDGTFTSWGKERTNRTPFHYRDGVRIWVSKFDLTPDDNFLGDTADTDQDGSES
jgi:hypothetical protein